MAENSDPAARTEAEPLLDPFQVAQEINQALGINAELGGICWDDNGIILDDTETKRQLIAEGQQEAELAVEAKLQDYLKWEQTGIKAAFGLAYDQIEGKGDDRLKAKTQSFVERCNETGIESPEAVDDFQDYIDMLVKLGALEFAESRRSQMERALKCEIANHWYYYSDASHKVRTPDEVTPAELVEQSTHLDLSLAQVLVQHPLRFPEIIETEESNARREKFLEKVRSVNAKYVKSSPKHEITYLTHTTTSKTALRILKSGAMDSHRNNFSINRLVSGTPAQDVTFIFHDTDLQAAIPFGKGNETVPGEAEERTYYPVNLKLVRAVVPTRLIAEMVNFRRFGGGYSKIEMPLDENIKYNRGAAEVTE